MRLGAVLGPSWGSLGRSWGPLGASWGRLGASPGHLAAILCVVRRKAAKFKKPCKTQVGMAFRGSKMSPRWAKLGSSCDLEPS